MNILVALRGKGDTADAYYRAIAPWSLVRYWTNHDIRVTTPSSADVAWADACIFQRAASAEEEVLVREAKDAGKPVIYDCDDNLFDIPPSAGELYAHYWEPGRMEPRAPLRHHARMLQMADMVTVPTAELGRLLSARVGKALNIRVLPNCVMRGDWDWLKPMQTRYEDGDAETVTVGWMGHLYHWDDFALIREALEAAICNENARLVIVGFPEVTRMFSPALLKRTRVENTVPFRQMGAVRQMMMAFDLGILPLADTPFCWGKSPLKAIQLGAAGKPALASEVVYGEVSRWETGSGVALGLPTIEEGPDLVGRWYQWLRMMIRDAGWRRGMARTWQERVWAAHCYESPIEIDGKQVPQAMLWLRAVEEAVEQCA